MKFNPNLYLFAALIALCSAGCRDRFPSQVTADVYFKYVDAVARVRVEWVRSGETEAGNLVLEEWLLVNFQIKKPEAGEVIDRLSAEAKIGPQPDYYVAGFKKTGVAYELYSVLPVINGRVSSVLDKDGTELRVEKISSWKSP